MASPVPVDDQAAHASTAPPQCPRCGSSDAHAAYRVPIRGEAARPVTAAIVSYGDDRLTIPDVPEPPRPPAYWWRRICTYGLVGGLGTLASALWAMNAFLIERSLPVGLVALSIASLSLLRLAWPEKGGLSKAEYSRKLQRFEAHIAKQPKAWMCHACGHLFTTGKLSKKT